MNKKLQIKCSIQIQKPSNEVFEAIVDPSKMSNYFISAGSGRMSERSTLTWQFPEMEMTFPVHVKKVEKDKYISYTWQGDEGEDLLVEISLEERHDRSTVVTITEKEKENNEKGIEWLKGNTEGWANFLASLKAYIEYGINLRKGAFDYRFEKM